MPQTYTKVTFVDADPSTADVRAQELLRAKARAHAARISHPSFRSSKTLPQSQQRKVPTKKSHSPEIKHEHQVDDYEDDHNNHLSRDILKFRLFIPKHKGNSDPFNSTAVKFTPLEYATVKWSRSMQIVTAWPSDVTMRQNMPTMLEAGKTAIGNLVDDAATIHAFIAYSCLHWYAMGRQTQSASLDPKYVTIAKKHSSLALRDLQKLINAQNDSQSRQGLEDVRNAATWLAASNIYSGNFGEAHLHFSAAMKIVDMTGGLRSLPDFESGLMIHAIIGLAQLMRSRPIIQPDDFDPGPWCQQDFTPVITGSADDFGTTLSRPPSPSPDDDWRPSTASTMQRRIFADMRELLTVEEYKHEHARSKSAEAEKVFRWSHFRKLAVRARNIEYWCDLVEGSSTPCGGEQTSPTKKAGLLDDTFDTCLVHATRLFDRCIFEEQYSPKGPFPLSKGNYMQLLKGLGEVRTNSTDTEIASRRYDMLWVSSIGAYFEDTFLQQRFAAGASPGPVTYLFAPQFTKLAAELEFHDVNETKEFLRTKYLYCPRSQDESLRKYFKGREE